jgi:hypothetical protein
MSITFFEIEFFKDSTYKWAFFVAIENFMIFLFFLISYESVPSWFKFMKQIEFEYVTRVLGSEYKKNLKLDADKIDNLGVEIKDDIDVTDIKIEE